MYPILIKIGFLKIPTYGLFLALGYLSGITLAVRRGIKAGLPAKDVFDLGFYIVFASLIGSKITLWLIDFEYYFNHPREILKSLRYTGVFFGGLILGILVAVYIIRKRNLPLAKTADVIAPGIALGYGIGRLGCFFAGCCYGKPTNLPWAVTFTNENSIAHPLNTPLHPVQIYSVLVIFSILGFLLWFEKRKKAVAPQAIFDGQIFLLYLVLYSAARFFLEFFRGDVERGFVFDELLSTSQFIGIIVFIISFILLLSQFARSATARNFENKRKNQAKLQTSKSKI